MKKTISLPFIFLLAILTGCADPAGPPVTKFKSYENIAMKSDSDGWYRIGNSMQYRGPLVNGQPHGEGECRYFRESEKYSSTPEKCAFDKGNRTDTAWVSARKKEADERRHDAWLAEQDRIQAESLIKKQERESNARMWASINSSVNQGIKDINQAQNRMAKQYDGATNPYATRAEQAISYAETNQKINKDASSSKESNNTQLSKESTDTKPKGSYSRYTKFVSIAPENIAVGCGKMLRPNTEKYEYDCYPGDWGDKNYEDISASAQSRLCNIAKSSAIRKAKELKPRQPYPTRTDTPSVPGVSACECIGFEGNSDATGTYYVPEYGHRWTSCRATTLVRWEITITKRK